MTRAHRPTQDLKLWTHGYQSVHQLQQWNMDAEIQYFHWYHYSVREGAPVQ